MGKTVLVWSPVTGDLPLTAALVNEILGGGGTGISETAITTAGAGVLAAAALLGGQIARSGPTAAFTDTTDTAANIATAAGGFVSGFNFTVTIKNATIYTETLAAGAGVTLPGSILIPPLSAATYFSTLGGTAASPTVTFTHQYTIAIHEAALITDPQASALNTVGAGTVLAASVNSGYTLRGGTQTAAFSDATDSAANLIAGVSAIANIVGSATEWTYVNNTIWPATLTAGANVTLTGASVIPANSWATYLVSYSAAGAVTIQCVAQGYFPNAGTFVANGVTPVTIANAAVTASSNISITLKTVGGTVGAIPHVETTTPGTGFTVIGTASDSSTYNYEIRG
jgi:hypothetical protein